MLVSKIKNNQKLRKAKEKKYPLLKKQQQQISKLIRLVRH